MLAAALVVAAATRMPIRSEHLFSWDSVNFALAMDRWDLSLHQPHPPGYVGYVLLGRLFQSGGADHNNALQLVSTFAAGGAAWLWWGIARRLGASSTHALLGVALLLSSPLIWLFVGRRNLRARHAERAARSQLRAGSRPIASIATPDRA